MRNDAIPLSELNGLTGAQPCLEAARIPQLTDIDSGHDSKSVPLNVSHVNIDWRPAPPPSSFQEFVP
jgi:hypothetical protein